jgi:Fic family protein
LFKDAARGLVKRQTGESVGMGSGDDGYQAFTPSPLPQQLPLKLSAAHHGLIERANRALGKLDGMAALLPNTALVIYVYARKEALVSSWIEGAQSSFSDLAWTRFRRFVLDEDSRP